MSDLKPDSGPSRAIGQMLIFVNRPYTSFLSELSRTFDGSQDVKIAMDRRDGDRRQKCQPVSVERRQGDRRKRKAKLLKVLISV